MKRISQGGFEDSFEDAVLEVSDAVALNELDEDVRKRLHGIELWMGAPLSELSAEEFEDFDIQTTWGDFPGAHALIGNGGYSRVIDHLRCQLAPTSLLLNAEVVHIDSSRSTEVVLQTKAGDELHAKCCICTIPLGVLKVRWAELFHPVLPESTVSAIEQLGFAQYSKLAVRMSAQFWEEVVPASVKERMWLWNPSPHTSFPFLLNYSKFKSCPVVLGLSVHKISSEEAVHAFSEAFATHCATDAATILSNMDDVLFVDWSTDRFALGAYSFFKVGCDWDAVDRLCHPAAVSASTRVRLAGEHCHAEYQGSVHAALLSGISVADSLLREFFSSGE
jgi:monoamine oxidase